MSDQRFPSDCRIRRGADFKRIYDRQAKAADGVLLVFADRSPVDTLTRIGLSVSRKHGGAVVRNRLKRLLREAFRIERTNLPVGLDVVVIPLQRDKASLSNYQESLRRLLKKVQKKLMAPPAVDRQGSSS